MKTFLLIAIFIFSTLICKAQNNQVNTLFAGRYETIIKGNQLKWDRGDIILLDENRYKMSTSNETGEYKFSVTAQRIFFTSGPLKSMYAKTSVINNAPAIVLPVAENEQSGIRLSSEILCYYKQ